MKTDVKKKLDAYYKCLVVINSCENHIQLNSADRMVDNFYNLFKDIELLKNLWQDSYTKSLSFGNNEDLVFMY